MKTTLVHLVEFLHQVTRNLRGLQVDIARNAGVWKVEAQTPLKPPEVIAASMNAAAMAYLERIVWVDAARADQTLWPRVGAIWAAWGGAEQDFTDVIEPLRAVATALRSAPKATYPQIIAACDAIRAAVDMPVNLWPES